MAAETPGDRTPTITYFDADMKPCPRERAAHAHVIDHDGTDDPPRYWVELDRPTGKEAKS